MARAKNPYAGTYGPAKVKVSKEDLIKGLRGTPKGKFPNRHMTTSQYKKGLKKKPEESDE